MDSSEYDAFDIGGFDEIMAEEEFEPTSIERTPELRAYCAQSHAYWMQTPLPADITPTGGAPLAQLSDEVLLTMSPTLLVHLQRTAASGGIQVVSPRTVPLASCAAHTDLSYRTTDMFIVGSNASRNSDWPVLSEPVDPDLFPGEPIDAQPYIPSLRPPSKSIGLVASAKRVADPVVRAFVTGRAMVDLQRRQDVAGSGDALSAHIAAAWGLDVDTYEAMAEASLAPVGPLLRYAIRSDDAYPVLNAPIHARKCISVGATSVGRQLYGEDAALDWRRIRVLAEAVFYMSVRLEGHNLEQMSLDEPPGDPRARPNRPGVIQMRPLPGSVWSHSPSTFRLDIADTTPIRPAAHFPDRIRAAIDKFLDTARPVALALAETTPFSMVPTAVRHTVAPNQEMLISGYRQVAHAAATFTVRGRTSAAAVRDYMYQMLSASNTPQAVRTLWTVRYLAETAAATGITAHIDDTLIRQLASRMSDMAHDMRAKLAIEANRRGTTLEAWWSDVTALLPRTLSGLGEGSASWAIAMAHFLVFPYSHKWAGLTRAMAIASHRSMASGAVMQVKLPARIRSDERVYEAGRAATRSLAKTYGAYYSAMFEVGAMLAGQLNRLGNRPLSDRFRIAALMWDIRAKAASSIDLVPGTADHPGWLAENSGPYRLSTAPQSAYTRWRDFMTASRTVSSATKRSFAHHLAGRVSDEFAGKRTPLFATVGQPGARLFRYAANPELLGLEIEKTMREISDDVAATLAQFEHEELPQDAVIDDGPRTMPIHANPSLLAPPPDSYWVRLTQMTQEDAMMIDDMTSQLPGPASTSIMEGSYVSPDALFAAVMTASGEATVAADNARDLVV